MSGRSALGLAVLFLAAAATTMAFFVWRGQTMTLALGVWSLCF
jgi:hypothetical protein